VVELRFYFSERGEQVNGMTERLRARVSRDFPETGSAEEVVRLVEAATGDERIQAAIVLAAAGSVNAIRSGVDLARIDFRDVLVSGGLAREDWKDVLHAELGGLAHMTQVLEEGRAAYRRARHWIDYAVHELPSGVLWGPDAATPAQCAEMLSDLDAFAHVCARLGLDDHTEYIEACRWHFDHYPHYLGRRRHFVDYETYIRDRGGPQRVPPPPAPRWF
jgi:hypothetical protein